MVKINTQTTTTTNDELPMPVMWKHTLLVVKDAPSFNKGETVTCYIAKYDGGRYCVFTASFIEIDQYHVFQSEQDLHDHFEEQ